MDSCVLIMDNASIYKNSSIKDLVEYNGHRLLFLPPYSSFLNPIENCFFKWKGYVRSACCANEIELLREVELGIGKITDDDCEEYMEICFIIWIFLEIDPILLNKNCLVYYVFIILIKKLLIHISSKYF